MFNLRVNPQTQNFQYNEYLEKQEVQNELGIALQQAKSINAGGIIYVSIYPRDIENLIPESDIPCAFCYSYSHGENYCVNCDDMNGGLIATDYLLSMGHELSLIHIFTRPPASGAPSNACW